MVLSDGEHYLEVPYWARGIIADEFERETEPLRTENDKLRELVRDFYPFASGRAENPWLSVRLERMRELGV